MATGGIFTLITNDGKQDRMLMATALLHERLRAINQMKLSHNRGRADDLQNLPTLLDIEKTHVLFTNAHFKPFAAIGFEYNKVRPTSGTPSLGQSIQFSIPQFGDFFHDICAHVTLIQPTLTNTASIASDYPYMRWCHFPGERLFKKVQQEVNGNPLDEYTLHATNMHREFKVAPNKRRGWDRCVGQEEAENGFLRQPDWVYSGVTPAAADARVAARVFNGNQTPSGQKATNLEMFIPLLFWYNKDVRLAVPSVAIPYGQRFINIELASRTELVDMVPRGASTYSSPGGTITEPTPLLSSIELYVNNIFVNPEVHKIYIKRVGFSLIRVHRQQLYNAATTSAEVLLQQLKWPIEFLFVGMKVKSYYASSDTATMREHLDKWHLFSSVTNQTYNVTGQETEKVSLFVTDPTATLGRAIAVAGVAPLTGTALAAQAVTADVTVVRIAGINHLVQTGVAAGAAVTGISVYTSEAITDALTAAAQIAATSRIVVRQGEEVKTQRLAKTMNTITVKAHGISIYNEFPNAFFNAYTSYHYGGPNINVPEDIGALFIPFCLYPGTYQPSGHINVSRAREFYLNWDSSVISSSVEGKQFALVEIKVSA